MNQRVRKVLCCALAAMLMAGGTIGCAGGSGENGSEGSAAGGTDTTTASQTTASSVSSSTAQTSAEGETTMPTENAATTSGKKTTVRQTTTTKKTTTTKAAVTTTTRRASLPSDAKVGSVGSGFYCVNFDKYGFDTKWKDLAQSDYVNTMFCDSTKFLAELKEYNVKVWCGVHDIYTKVVNNTAGWKDSFDELYQEIKDSGHEDAVLGWYIDEPDNMPAVKELSRYAQKYGKRFFICFTVAATNGEVYGGYQGAEHTISKDTMQYLTDIAVDHYWDVDEGNNKAGYQKLYKSLHNAMPDDCKVWYIPNTFAGWSIVDKRSAEIQAAAKIRIRHIQYMYECLKAEPVKNRGGILFFAYDFNSSAEKLYGLWNINEKTNGAWNSVMNEAIRVGREICTGKISG